MVKNSSDRKVKSSPSVIDCCVGPCHSLEPQRTEISKPEISSPTFSDSSPDPQNVLVMTPEIAFPPLSRDRMKSLKAPSIALLNAFGIGGQPTRDLVISAPTPIELHLPQIVMLNGPSGAGKTTLGRSIWESLSDDSPGQLSSCDRGKPLIEAFYEDAESTFALLSDVGLADAFTLCRTFDELSDGQKFRFNLAEAIHSGSSVIFVDEFCSNLDRPLARSLAFVTQKIIRRNRITLIAATAHDDLVVDLMPDTRIVKGWNREPQIEYRSKDPEECSIFDECVVTEGTFQDYAPLKHLHYIAGPPTCMRAVIKVEHPAYDEPIAVLVGTYPHLHSGPRNSFTDDRYAGKNQSENAKLLNSEVVNIARVIVSPNFRRLGLTRLLIDKLIDVANPVYVESTAQMGRYSPFFVSQGFSEVPIHDVPAEADIHAMADSFHMPAYAAFDADSLQDWIDGLSVRKCRFARKAVWLYYHHFVLHRRTRKRKPKVIPGPLDNGWQEAFSLVSQRLTNRPSYFIKGPLREPYTSE